MGMIPNGIGPIVQTPSHATNGNGHYDPPDQSALSSIKSGEEVYKSPSSRIIYNIINAMWRSCTFMLMLIFAPRPKIPTFTFPSLCQNPEEKYGKVLSEIGEQKAWFDRGFPTWNQKCQLAHQLTAFFDHIQELKKIPNAKVYGSIVTIPKNTLPLSVDPRIETWPDLLNEHDREKSLEAFLKYTSQSETTLRFTTSVCLDHGYGPCRWKKSKQDITFHLKTDGGIDIQEKPVHIQVFYRFSSPLEATHVSIDPKMFKDS